MKSKSLLITSFILISLLSQVMSICKGPGKETDCPKRKIYSNENMPKDSNICCYIEGKRASGNFGECFPFISNHSEESYEYYKEHDGWIGEYSLIKCGEIQTQKRVLQNVVYPIGNIGNINVGTVTHYAINFNSQTKTFKIKYCLYGNPSLALNILEYKDGKIIFHKMSSTDECNWSVDINVTKDFKYKLVIARGKSIKKLNSGNIRELSENNLSGKKEIVLTWD